MCILPISSWVGAGEEELCSGRWGLCSPEKEPVHHCHCGPQGLAGYSLHKGGKLILLQVTCRTPFPPHVLVYALFQWSSSVRALSEGHGLLLLSLRCVSVWMFQKPASLLSGLLLGTASGRATVMREPPAMVRSSIGETLRGVKGPSPCSCLLGKGAAVAISHSDLGVHWYQ